MVTVLQANSEEKLQNLVDIVDKKSREFGMQLNKKKTETMITTKKKKHPTVNGSVLRRAQKFKYLGTMVNWDARNEIELNTRNAKSKASFDK